MKCETIIFVRYSKQPFIVQQMHPIVGSKKMLHNLQFHISLSSKIRIYFWVCVKKGGVYKGTISTQKSKYAFKISQHHNSPIKYHDSNLRFSNHVFLLTGVEVQQYNLKIVHIAIKFDKKIIISIEKALIVKTNNLKRIELKEDINKVTLSLALTTKMLQMRHKPFFFILWFALVGDFHKLGLHRVKSFTRMVHYWNWSWIKFHCL
jgi:hypothetical protein